MKKDIFIDNNIASKYFSTPTDEEYKKLIDWLGTHNKDEENDAYLVVSPYLIREYNESNRNARSETNILNILIQLTKQGRLVHFTKKDIEAFQARYFSNKVLKKLRTKDTKDRNHIPAILMSDRKMLLSEEDKFIEDLYEFSGFNPITAKRPERLPYKGENTEGV
jgi:lipid II:glycine glycyltransferase (peptidoglycan interpeptide bridge formation enzyme)